MRTRRGLIASIGAATSLILAGTMALAAVSTVIAFNGWPGVKGSVAESTPTLLATASHAEHSHSRESRAVVVVPPAPVIHREPVHRAQPHKGHVSRVVSTPADTEVTANVVTPAHVAASSNEPAKTTAADNNDATASVPKRSDLGKTVSDVGDGLGKTVQDTGTVLGGVVAPLSPELGKVVTNATDAVGGIVQKATDLLGRVLDILLPKH